MEVGFCRGGERSLHHWQEPGQKDDVANLIQKPKPLPVTTQLLLEGGLLNQGHSTGRIGLFQVCTRGDALIGEKGATLGAEQEVLVFLAHLEEIQVRRKSNQTPWDDCREDVYL